MGGSVAVTVRFSADRDFRMLWGTGELETFKGKGFLCRESQYLEECKARWSDTDYMGLLAPVGYGLVVVDFVTNRILASQGYTDLQTIYISSLSLHGDRQDVAGMIEAGKIQDVDYERYVWPTRQSQHGTASISKIHHDPVACIGKIVEWYERNWSLRMQRNVEHRKRVSLTPERLLLRHDFQVEAHDHLWEEPDWIEFKRKITDEMGFILTDEEDRQWDQWIAKQTRN